MAVQKSCIQIRRSLLLAVWMGVCMLGTAGCKPGCCPLSSAPAGTTDEVALTNQNDSEVAPAEVASKDAESIKVRNVSGDDLEKWVSEQKGKVVVVDLWSTWCESCKREFPHFVELHQQMKDTVVFASYSLDFSGTDGKVTDDVTEQVAEFLKSQKATMTHFVASDGDEATMKRFSIASIPAALVFDREGKLHKVFKNDDNEYGETGFTYEKNIAPLVRQLVQ